MTVETSGETGPKINVRVPRQERIKPYAAPRIVNGVLAADSQAEKDELDLLTKPNVPRAFPATSIEDEATTPLRSGQPDSAAVIAAVDKVRRTVVNLIAYHERELQKLRACLKPFSDMVRQPDAPSEAGLGPAIQSLLALADRLPQQSEGDEDA